jgi:hypothetical protein
LEQFLCSLDELAMKAIQALVAALAALPRWTSASSADRPKFLTTRDAAPQMPYDPNTIQTCTWWYDNYLDLSCTDVRDSMYLIRPSDFSRWNPSITLDCGNWQWLSYCVQVKSEQVRPTTTSRATPTTSITRTTSVTAKPTLLGWESLGCYVDEIPHTLSNKTTREGGSQLTIDKCEAACFADDFLYAGVKAGTECWCSDFVGNEWVPDQKACNIPCGGQSSQICGGASVLSVYKAKIKDTLPSFITVAATTTATTAATATTTTKPPRRQCNYDLAVPRLLQGSVSGKRTYAKGSALSWRLSDHRRLPDHVQKGRLPIRGR